MASLSVRHDERRILWGLKRMVASTDPLAPAAMRKVSDGSEAIISAVPAVELIGGLRQSARRGLFLRFSTADGNLMLNRLVPGSSDHNRHAREKFHRSTDLSCPLCSGGRHRGRCHA